MKVDTEIQNNVPVIEAAKEMGKSPQFIRVNLQNKKLPFGTAEIISGERYTYYINPNKFFEYIGKPIPSKYKEKEELQGKERYKVITDPAIIRTINWRERK